MRALVPLALLLATGASAGDRLPAATPAGAPVDCLAVNDIRETRVRSDRVIDFVGTGRRVWRNTLPHACAGLGFERRFAYATSLSRLCSVDTITVLYAAPLTPGARCGLGAFQPVTLAR